MIDTTATRPLLTPSLWGTELGVQKDVSPWWFAGLAFLGLTLLTLLAANLDGRTLAGVSVWSKPFKFSLSLTVYFLTLVCFARLLPSTVWRSTWGKALVWVPIGFAAFEIVYITYQGAIGQGSHFNTDTPFHALMYSLMGFGAVTLVTSLLAMGLTIAKHRSLAEPVVFAVVVGIVLTFLLGGGFGGYLGGQSGHWVGGTASDANGTWLFNWSRDGGDLRVAHFFGMHAMQAIPLFALLLDQLFGRRFGQRSGQHLSRSTKIATITAFATAYAAFTITTFVQAVQGQPFTLG